MWFLKGAEIYVAKKDNLALETYLEVSSNESLLGKRELSSALTTFSFCMENFCK